MSKKVIALIIGVFLAIASITVAYYLEQQEDVTPEKTDAAECCGCYWVDTSTHGYQGGTDCSDYDYPEEAESTKRGVMVDGECTKTCTPSPMPSRTSWFSCPLPETWPCFPECNDVTLTLADGSPITEPIDGTEGLKVSASFQANKTSDGPIAFTEFYFILTLWDGNGNDENQRFDVNAGSVEGVKNDQNEWIYTPSKTIPANELKMSNGELADNFVIQAYASDEIDSNITGESCRRAREIFSNNAPNCSSLSSSSQTFENGTPVSLTANVSDGDSGIKNVKFYWTEKKSDGDYCVSADMWNEIGNGTKQSQGVWSINWTPSGIPEGQGVVIAANVTDNDNWQCLGNPSGACGTGISSCSQCSTQLSQLSPDCGDGECNNANEKCEGTSLPGAGISCIEDGESVEECRTNCTYCGDGIVQEEFGEECDDDTESCSDDCKLNTDYVVDKDGPQCVERTSPNNQALFSVEIRNNTDVDRDLNSVTDILPVGFTYLADSSTLDGTAVSDNSIQLQTDGDSQIVVWEGLGHTIPAGETSTLNFTATASQEALTGDNTNEVYVGDEEGDFTSDYTFEVADMCITPQMAIFDTTQSKLVAGGVLLILSIIFYYTEGLYLLPSTETVIKREKKRLNRHRKSFEDKIENLRGPDED